MTPLTREERREASRPLAAAPGMLPLYPAELPAVREDIAPEILDWRSYPSASEPGKSYLLARTAGGWQHWGEGCRGWLIRGECRHVRSMNLESTALVPSNTNVLALLDELEDREIIKSIQGELTEVWVYEFPMGGKTVVGVSAKGVENGCRELAKKGEAIREMDVRVEYEDDQEARFVAQAGRYAIAIGGGEQLLDVAIRAKRQAKFMKRRDGSLEFDDHWYEKGVTKAVRNAKLALMPESAVALIIAEAKKVGKHKQLANAPQGNRAPQRQAPANVDRETGEIGGGIPPEGGYPPSQRATQEQHASIHDFLDAIETRHNKAARTEAMKWAIEKYPYAVKDGAISLVALSRDDASEFIAELRRRHEEKRPPAGPPASTPKQAPLAS